MLVRPVDLRACRERSFDVLRVAALGSIEEAALDFADGLLRGRLGRSRGRGECEYRAQNTEGKSPQ